MSVLAVTEGVDLSSHEFDVSCEHRSCDESADYMVWFNHNDHGCDRTFYRCAACLQQHIASDRTSYFYALQGVRCVKCGRPVLGSMWDNIRVVPL